MEKVLLPSFTIVMIVNFAIMRHTHKDSASNKFLPSNAAVKLLCEHIETLFTTSEGEDGR